MTNEENVTFEFIKGHCCQLNSVSNTDINPRTPVKSVCTHSKTFDTTIVSDATSNPDHNRMVISLNYSSDNYATVLDNIIGAQVLNEEMERNLKKKVLMIPTDIRQPRLLRLCFISMSLAVRLVKLH